MGSIPTRSRQLSARAGWLAATFGLALILGLCACRGVAAQEPAQDQDRPVGYEGSARIPGTDTTGAAEDARADSLAKVRERKAGPWYRRPKWVMLRSAVVPGWGQWANGKHVKALVVAGGEGYLIYRAVDWGRQERVATSAFEKEHAASRRRDFTWWTIFAAALSLGDAYVDAQLRGFDQEFRDQGRESGQPEPAASPEGSQPKGSQREGSQGDDSQRFLPKAQEIDFTFGPGAGRSRDPTAVLGEPEQGGPGAVADPAGLIWKFGLELRLP